LVKVSKETPIPSLRKRPWEYQEEPGNQGINNHPILEPIWKESKRPINHRREKRLFERLNIWGILNELNS